MTETVIEWTSETDYAAITAPSGSALKNKLLRMAEAEPDVVQVLTVNKDGSVFAHVPRNYIAVRKPKQLSEEQRAAAGERLRKWREDK